MPNKANLAAKHFRRAPVGNDRMSILFLHGWHSIVGGVKPTFLKQHGLTVFNPKLNDDDFDEALRVAQGEYDLRLPAVIVGSSRGGAIAMNIRSGETPLVLLCPAWKRWGQVTKLKPNSLILHSRHDDVIPFQHSEELVVNSGLPSETLIEVGSDHRLADDASLSVMLWACRVFASGEPLPWLEDEPNRPTRSKKATGTSQDDASYICDACGEEIVIPVDLSEGTRQSYVEDCPVCCRANIIHVAVDDDGIAEVWAEPEQDND
jgi:Cysteine-rich CPXCG